MRALEPSRREKSIHNVQYVSDTPSHQSNVPSHPIQGTSEGQKINIEDRISPNLAPSLSFPRITSNHGS
jgi:hypothetical protein